MPLPWKLGHAYFNVFIVTQPRVKALSRIAMCSEILAHLHYNKPSGLSWDLGRLCPQLPRLREETGSAPKRRSAGLRSQSWERIQGSGVPGR